VQLFFSIVDKIDITIKTWNLPLEN